MTDLESARKLLQREAPRNAAAARGFSLAVYPGTFNPPTHAHVAVAQAVIDEVPGVEAVWLDMAVHKGQKADAGALSAARLEMTSLAVEGVVRGASATCVGPKLRSPLGAEYFEVMRALASGSDEGAVGADAGADAASPAAEGRRRLTWIMGSDVLEGMRRWREQARERLMQVDGLAVVLRGSCAESDVRNLLRELLASDEDERRAPRLTVLRLPEHLANVSSSAARQGPPAKLAAFTPRPVAEYVMASEKLTTLYGWRSSSEEELDEQIKRARTQAGPRCLDLGAGCFHMRPQEEPVPVLASGGAVGAHISPEPARCSA